MDGLMKVPTTVALFCLQGQSTLSTKVLSLSKLSLTSVLSSIGGYETDSSLQFDVLGVLFTTTVLLLLVSLSVEMVSEELKSVL